MTARLAKSKLMTDVGYRYSTPLHEFIDDIPMIPTNVYGQAVHGYSDGNFGTGKYVLDVGVSKYSGECGKMQGKL